MKRFLGKFKATRDLVNEENVELPWHLITNENQLAAIEKESETVPVLIFKHSTRCGISRAVLRMFERHYNLKEEEIKLYFLDLLQHRALSNEIAQRFKVHHESPQVLLIAHGACVYHASHHSIDAAQIKTEIDQL